MENKYYTPEIEEFHIGFEFEYFEPVRTEGYVKSEIFFPSDISDAWDHHMQFCPLCLYCCCQEYFYLAPSRHQNCC